VEFVYLPAQWWIKPTTSPRIQPKLAWLPVHLLLCWRMEISLRVSAWELVVEINIEIILHQDVFIDVLLDILLIIPHGVVFWSALLDCLQRLSIRHARGFAQQDSMLIIRLDIALVFVIQLYISIVIIPRGNACLRVVGRLIIMQILILNCARSSVRGDYLLIILLEFASLRLIARIRPSGILSILDVYRYALLPHQVSLITIRTYVYGSVLSGNLLITQPWNVLNNVLQILITLSTTTPMLMVLLNKVFVCFSAQ
jgi:hypothetical protein